MSSSTLTMEEYSPKIKSKSRRKSLAAYLLAKLSLKRKNHASCPEEDMEAILRATRLSQEGVEEQYHQFLKSHPSGTMDPASLRAMLREALPGADTTRLAHHVWRILDTNQDGVIDFRELMLALAVMRSGSPEENLRQIFRVFDVNSDGKVERGELGLVAQELEVGEDTVCEAFAEMDADRDGGVTEEEFVTACLQQRRASTCLVVRVIDIFVDS